MVGKVDFATAVINYFIMFASLGIPTYGIRACAKVRENKDLLSQTVKELLIINIITTIFAYIVFLISLQSVQRFKDDSDILLICSINLLLNGFGMNWLYSALEEYQYITIRSVGFKLISLICIFLMVHNPDDYLVYVVITVFSTSGSYILNFLYSRKKISYQRKTQYNFRQHMIPILTFFATSVAISIYTNLDIVMIGIISGDAEVGYYSAAMKIRAAVATFVTALSTVLLPRLSFYASNRYIKEFEKLFVKSLNFTILMAFPLTVYFLIYAKECIVLLSGIQFANAAPVLRFLIPTILIAGLSNVTGTQLLVPWGNENKLLFSIVCGAIIDFLANLVLIPSWGACGAAFATLVAECIVLLVQIYCSFDFLKVQLKKTYILKKAFSLLIATLTAFIINPFLPENRLLYLVFSFIIFEGMYFLVLLVIKDCFIMELFAMVKKMLKEKFL